MFRKLTKALCMILCLAMLISGVAVFAEGGEVEHVQRTWYEKTPFIDVTEDSWYDMGCRYVYKNSYMVGISEELFVPHELITREMAVVTIVKILSSGGPEYSYDYNYDEGVSFDLPHYETSYFKDVEPGKWYSDSVQWAFEQGITSGIGNDCFGVGQPIAREDFLTMLYHTMLKSELIFYNDVENERLRCIEQGEKLGASEYAREAVGFFSERTHGGTLGEGRAYPLPIEIRSQVLCGYPKNAGGTIEYGLRDTLTRAQAAKMIHAFSPYPIRNFFENN